MNGHAVGEADLAPLPLPAQRYMRFMGVAGRPRDRWFRIEFTGRFRMKSEAPWMACRTWQENIREPISRMFRIRIRYGGIVPIVGRDTYVAGHGRMRIRFFDVIPIADERGPEYDTSELVTYMNDAMLLAPSMLLVPTVEWSAVDETTFDVALTDHGRTVSARIVVDGGGRLRTFSTNDRYCYDPDHPARLLRARWTTPVEGWDVAGSRPIPAGAQAVWDLPRGPFAYADFRPLPDTFVCSELATNEE